MSALVAEREQRWRAVFTTRDGRRVLTPALFDSDEDASWHVVLVCDAAVRGADHGRRRSVFALRDDQGCRVGPEVVNPDGLAYVEPVANTA